MKRSLLITAVSLAAVLYPGTAVGATDYSDGIFIVNEDWYGHQNSSVNFLNPDAADGEYWQYRVVRTENPGMELGATSQFGTLWDGRLYVISKQDKDPGATIPGGRINVMDAATMKILHQQALIDPSGAPCDGRGFVGVDSHKGYVSSSNGIWVLDLDNYTVTGQVEGSANPNISEGSSDGSLYYGQTGKMVLADGKVFAAHQQYGLLVIDTTADKVVKMISMDLVQEGAGIGSIVRSKDGDIWLSVAKNVKGSGDALGCLVRVDPETLETETVTLPETVLGPANSWYAWTPDAFAASAKQNTLYWKGGATRWFSGSQVYKFDIDTRTATLFVDLDKEGANWKLYGCSLGVHPETDEIYMSLYHEVSKPTYITRRYSPSGEVIRDYPMINNFWFPAIPIFTTWQNMADINAIEVTPQPVISYSNGVLRVNNAETGSNLSIHSLSGSLAASYAIHSSECMEIPLEGTLQPGVYIARCGSSTLKLAIN